MGNTRALIESLKTQATKTAKMRGHTVKWNEVHKLSEPRVKPQRLSQFGRCSKCGSDVYILTHPRPNQIDIAGGAVAESCGS